MKVVHGSFQFTSGGAARAARRICESQLKAGFLISTLGVSQPHCTNSLFEEHLLDPDKAALRARLEGSLLSKLGLRDGNIRNLGLLPSEVPSLVEAINPDLVNIHWIGHSFLAGWQVSKFNKPVVWTMHDLWAASGTLHYPMSRELIGKSGASDFFASQQSRRSRLIERMMLRIKQRSTREITFVAPTQWLADETSTRLEMEEGKIHVVPIPIPTHTFSAGSTQIARQRFRMPLDRPIVGFASDTNDRYAIKGAHLLPDIMKSVRRRAPDALLVNLSASDAAEDAHAISSEMLTLTLPLIHDDAALADFYRACDVLAVPSLLDNFNQVAAEALSCGTPVVAFDNSGLRTVIQDQKTGLLAPAFDTVPFGELVAEILTNDHLRLSMSRAARERALKEWSYSVVAGNYEQVYQSVLSK